MRQHGFLTLGLTGYIALGAIAAIGIASATAYVQTKRLGSLQAEYATFRADVKAKGELAEKEAARINADNLKRKETADATNTKLRADVAALAKRLRDSRAATSFLPQPSASASSPDRITFQRADLERAIQRFDAGVSGIVAEGDGAVTDLNSARSWAAGR